MTDPERAQEPDSIDEAAAGIDARSPDAPEQVEELVEHAAEEGRIDPQPPPVGAPGENKPHPTEEQASVNRQLDPPA